MLKAFSKAFVIATILIAFLGQAMVFNAVIACENTSADNLSINPYETSNTADLMEIEAENGEDCCDNAGCEPNCGCLCAANGCSPFTYLAAEVSSTGVVVFSDAKYSQQSAHPKPISTSHYRPPILSSLTYYA